MFLVLHYTATIPLGMVCIRTEDQLELVISTTEAQCWVKLVLRLCLLLQCYSLLNGPWQSLAPFHFNETLMTSQARQCKTQPSLVGRTCHLSTPCCKPRSKVAAFCTSSVLHFERSMCRSLCKLHESACHFRYVIPDQTSNLRPGL
jgi:hypothetical protein